MPGPRGCRARGRTVLAALLLVLVGVAAAGCSRQPAPAPGVGAGAAAGATGTTGSTGVPSEVADLLDRRSRAALGHDRTGWLETVDPADPAFLTGQRAVADALAVLPVTGWRYRPGGVLSSTPDRLELHVLLGYRLAGDTRDVDRDQVLTLTRSAAGWRVAGQRAGLPQPADLWDLGPVAVRRGVRSVVLGAAPLADRLPDFATALDAAAATVDSVWGTGWPRTVIALLPADGTGMAALLGPDHGTGLERLAAVTTGDVDVRPAAGGGPRPSADRVVLNPQAFAGFGPVARQVVLTHEVTHLATRASGAGPVPLWLEEGLADYVAYRGTGLPRADVAADLAVQARAGHAPTALPGPEAFDAARGPVDAAYQAAWLAVDLVARLAGPQAPVALYRRAAADGLAAAVRDVLGTDPAGFQARWQEAVRALATEPSAAVGPTR